MSPLKSTFGAASAFGWLPRGSGNPMLTNVEYTLWAGGFYSGGYVVKNTGQALNPGGSYTVTVGAVNSPSRLQSSGLDVLAINPSSTQSGTTINGTQTVYSLYNSPPNNTGFQNYWNNNWYYNLFGWQYVNFNSYVELLYGFPGAGGFGGAPSGNYNYISAGSGGPGFAPVGAGLTNFPALVSCGGGGYSTQGGGVGSQTYDWNWNYYNIFWTLGYGSTPFSGPNLGNGSFENSSNRGSGGFTMRYSNTQLPLAATTGDVVYLNSGGYHNYFWKSTGGFTI